MRTNLSTSALSLKQCQWISLLKELNHFLPAVEVQKSINDVLINQCQGVSIWMVLSFLEKYKGGNKYTCIPALFVDSMSSYISVQKKICILSKTFLHQIFDSLPFSSSGERKTSTSSVSFGENKGFIFHTFVRETKFTTYKVGVKSLIFYVSCLDILLNLK